VYSGQSSGTTLGLEVYPFAQTSARYVRITGHGNTSNAWNSITEVEIWKDGGYQYSWDFGDGATSDEKDPAHTYTQGGSYSAVLTVTDGLGTATDSVTITVSAANVPPVAEDQSVTTDRDTPVDITLVAVDPDGSGSGNFALGASVSASSTHDSYSADEINDGDNSTGFSSQWSNASGDMPCWVALSFGTHITFDRVELYTCDGYELKDFRIQCYTGGAWTDLANVSGNTHPHLTFVLDAPATGSMVRVYCTSGPDRQAHYARVCELELYMDATVLTYQIVDPPAHGTLSGTAPDVTYTPDTGYAGTDAFTFRAYDGRSYSNVATVDITVVGSGGNTPPVAHDQSITMDEDTSRDVTLSATDAEGDPLTYMIVEIPGYGELAGTPPNVTYIPDGDYYGTDCFTFRAGDGTEDSNLATVSITVVPVADAPVARDGSAEVASGSSVGITLQAYDVDEDPLTYVIVTSPAGGTLSGDDGDNLVTYTPHGGFAGDDTFTFVANDGTSDSNVATVTVSVSGDIVSIVSVSTERPYSLAPAEVDSLYYIDRNYRISSLTTELEGAVLVRTANNDKYVTEPDHLVLRIGEPATLSVCYDRRWSTLPAWLEDGTWTARGAIVSVTDRAASPLEVFEKTVQPGDITLGANRSDGAAGSRSNYMVIVRRAGTVGTGSITGLANGESVDCACPRVTNYVVGPLAPDEWLDEDDTDGDGLSDDFEIEQGLDPENADTNGDGVFDEYESDLDGRDLFDIQLDTDIELPDEPAEGGSGGGCFLGTARLSHRTSNISVTR
jgi:PKD repeat protein